MFCVSPLEIIGILGKLLRKVIHDAALLAELDKVLCLRTGRGWQHCNDTMHVDLRTSL